MILIDIRLKDKEYIFYFERIKDIFIKKRREKGDEKYYLSMERHKMG